MMMMLGMCVGEIEVKFYVKYLSQSLIPPSLSPQPQATETGVPQWCVC